MANELVPPGLEGLHGAAGRLVETALTWHAQVTGGPQNTPEGSNDMGGWVWQQATPWGIVGFLVVLVVTGFLSGRIISRRTYLDMEAQRDKWEEAWRLSQATIGEFGPRIDATGEALRTVEKALAVVLDRADRGRTDR